MPDSHDFMREAITEARRTMEQGKGKPFGAVVVHGGVIVGRGANIIFRTGDPTDHAEIRAMREAAKTLGRPSLEGCDLYATGQPCLMCLGTAFLLRVPRLYYANSYKEAEAYGYKGGSAACSLAEALGAELERFDGDFRTSPNMEIVRLRLPEAEDLYRAWRESGRSL